MIVRVFLILLISCIFNLHANNKPNILLISIDDLNDWVGYMKGHPQVKTPNIDKLAQKGTAFMDAHCSSPMCNPSRTSLLTGLHAPDTGVFNNTQGFKFKNFETMPQYFAKHGYKTYGVGKIHHKKINSSIFQVSKTLEQRWSPFQDNKRVLYTKEELPSKGTDNPYHLIKNGPGGKDYVLPLNRMPSDRKPDTKSGESHDWGAFDLPDNAFGDGMAAEWVIEQLSQHDSSQSFFMGFGLYRPHIPLFAPQKYFDLYPLNSLKMPPYKEDDLNDLSESGKKWALEAITAGSHATTVKYGEWQKAVQAYLACVSFVDAQIGKVLNYLEKSPFADNTIIVLFSDHGWHLGEKDHWGKWTGWNRSTRVPFIVVQAGQKKGQKCLEPVSVIDIYPTLIDMSGLPQIDMDASSIKPMVQNPQLELNRTVYSYFDKGNIAVINKKWRLIQYADGSQELYNRINDPNEWHNLIKSKEYLSVTKELSKHIPYWSQSK